jgi:hypothetical protein
MDVIGLLWIILSSDFAPRNLGVQAGELRRALYHADHNAAKVIVMRGERLRTDCENAIYAW